MRKLILTAQFRKDAKLAKRRNLNTAKLDDVINLLLRDEPLAEHNRNHVLQGGRYHGHSECHIEPDWLLIYLLSQDGLILTAVRTGTHSDLF